MQAYIYVVSGRVQGVGFRWFTEREALKRGVTGYVRNLPDGRVEVWAQGEGATLAEFSHRLREGPAAARVDDVERRPAEVDPTLSAFQTRF